MHVVPQGRLGAWRLLRSHRARLRLRERVRALLIDLIASPLANYRSIFSGPRVRIDYMREGGVGIALSVLYSFFDEADVLDGPRPHANSLESIEAQIGAVRKHIHRRHPGDAFIATRPDELNAHGDRVTLVHCVEGGFHLGGTPGEVTKSVERLAAKGIAYITLAHLIWRGIATDAPALPFMNDAEYHRWLPQPDEGLSDLGRAAVRAMVRKRVLIDVSHMSRHSLQDTFELLDELDPARKVPVLATHTGFRFGKQEYLLDTWAITKIAERNGVIGLIFARHQLEDGPPPGLTPRPSAFGSRRRFRHSLEVLRAHIDAIHKVTEDFDHIAIGSDFDGFIKPTLASIEDPRAMVQVEAALKKHYGERTAELICSENALRPLRTYWGGAPR